MGFYSPGLGVEVVGARAEVVGKAERGVAIGDEDDAARYIGRQGESLTAQVGDGGGVVQIDYWPGAAVGGEAIGQRGVGPTFFVFCFLFFVFRLSFFGASAWGRFFCFSDKS